MPNLSLVFDQVSFSYTPNTPIFKSFDLDLINGEFVSLIGASGSGKTTLLRLITGLEEPSSGTILINGKKLEKRLGAVGYMPQHDLLLPWRTVLQNAALPLEIKGVPKKAITTRVTALLDEFGLSGYENHLVHHLSGGMRQRVAFLRTMLSGSNLLLLDEPFSALDAITKLQMQEWLLKQWRKWRQSILFITHDVNEALFLSDRIFILSGGNKSSNQQLQSIKVPLKRPRNLHDLDTPPLIAIKNRLLYALGAFHREDRSEVLD